ncbi:hypothetical protein LSUE1_G006860 [Lachnellula suecica]|uniref:NACHT domain-containing protein n=1 Tax=Lachnellula suecica TaxID=602035 RepID=A0A8T9C921_9HELO|nr:hypothetical protein LSUE1_G006860 [Lachnellula suecica]
MDPIAAVSLVATVCQLIDFSAKVVSYTHEIYKSANGSLTVDNELSQAASHIFDLSEKLHPDGETAPTCHTRDEQALVDICNSCNVVATELYEKLGKLRDNEAASTWTSFKKAIRHAWSDKERVELSRRLSALRGALELNVLVNLRQNLETHFEDFGEGLREIARIATTLEENQTEASRELQDHTVEITQLISRSEEANGHHHKETRELIIQAIEEMKTPSGRRRSIQQFPGLIPALKVAERDIILSCESWVLKGLTFLSITDRYDDVEEAHLQTFEWIFERRPSKNRPGDDDKKIATKKWSNFVDWLRGGQGVYWINGKAASGKSTLMRYIYDHGQTHKELCAWSKDVPLATAGFFFWLAGTTMQKSQFGLLRGLLHEILRQHRRLIPIIFPDEWDSIHTQTLNASKVIDAFAPTLAKVKRACMLLVKQTMVPMKFCFFVDGLDEYDGDHEEIAELFKSVASLPNVKVCISSRPLLVCEDTYRGSPSLRLQDLTLQDIELYTTEKLQMNSKFQRLAIQEPEQAPILILEIVMKADGVFLWVKLVVASLLAGLRNRDELSDLHQRLLALPKGLEELYEYMLRVRIESFYENQASQIFQLVHAVDEPHSSISLALAMDEKLHKTIYTRESSLSATEISDRCEMVSDRLKSRCAGLLEIRGVHEDSCNMGTVQYMHRTVRDFLEIPNTWSFLISATAGTNFRPHKYVLKSILLYQRLVPKRYNGPGLLSTARQVLNSAKEACMDVDDPQDPLGPLLSTLNISLSAEYSEKGYIASDPPHWSGPVDFENATQWPDSFVSAAVKYGLISYLEEQLNKRQDFLIKKPGRPLLDIAICAQQGNMPPVPLSQKKNMATLLLNAGADPNQIFGGGAVWQNFIIHATAKAPYFSSEGLEILLEIQEELVKFGASFAGVVNTLDGQIRWGRMIYKLFHKLSPERTEKVIASIQGADTVVVRPLSPKSPHLMPGNHLNATVSKSEIHSGGEDGSTSDGGNSNLKKESSIARRIRGWRRSMQ